MAGPLAGRVAVVTGAGAGIGAACARAYAAQGARVVLGDIDADAGAATVAAISEAGGEAHFRRLDVADSAGCEALVAWTVATFGTIDIMHANAGIELCRSVWDTTDAEWDRVIAVNLSGSFYCARAAMRAMRAAGRPGAVLLTASPHAFMTSREIAAYAASKGGQVALMRALALEGAPFGIRVNAILPGAIETPMLHREAASTNDPAALLATFAAAQPMGRLGQPEDVAKVAAFLVSDAASFVTGTCLAADGGLMAAINSGPAISYTGESS
ncbi:MAG: SDR family NAD(P)-dependent oxidoreductase [Alphaproteobacteria bacterium]|nr:SDR family NAD(P)-dependent oxidoreductase [Alphaproteobacteria bacterium]